MGILPGSGPLGSGPTGPGSGFSVMPINAPRVNESGYSIISLLYFMISTRVWLLALIV